MGNAGNHCHRFVTPARVVDVWVNNVGQGITRVPSQLTDEDIDDMMRIIVKSALYGMQEVLPHVQSRKRGSRHRRLVHARPHAIASVGTDPAPENPTA